MRVGTGNEENQIAAHCSFFEGPLAKYLTNSAMDSRVGQKGSRSNEPEKRLFFLINKIECREYGETTTYANLKKKKVCNWDWNFK